MVNNTGVSRKWLAPLIAALLAAAVLLVWNKYPPISVESPEPVSRVDRSGLNRIYFGPSNSIAVLPFENSAASTGLPALADGFSRELHRLLTRNPGLRVTSLNSSHFFRDRAVPPKVIAERLQVTHLVLGEFDSSNGKVRVAVRLFSAIKDKELWFRVFERDLGDAFILQDEILFSVVDAINGVSVDRTPSTEAVNTDAWLTYLQGLGSSAQRTQEGLRSADQAFRSALDIEPDYDVARIGLARVSLAMGIGGEQQQSFIESARALLFEVLESDPDQPDALGLMSYIQHHFDWNWHEALESAEKALKMRPGDPELMNTASLAMSSTGQFDRASELLEAAVKQDAINLIRRLRLGLLQEFAGDYDQSLLTYRQVIGLNPESPGAHAFRARIKIIQENPESALRESAEEVDLFWQTYSQVLALIVLERHEEAEPLLERLIEDEGNHAAYQIAEILAFRGDIDSAFEWLERAIEQKDGGMTSLMGNFFLRNLHVDPRWEDLIERMGLALAES